jgi:hypothetical protein
MAEYNAGGNIAGGVKQQLTDLTSKYFNGSAQLHMIAPAVGLTEMPGHENASCGAVNATLFPVLVSVSNCVGPEPVLANDQFEKALEIKVSFLRAGGWPQCANVSNPACGCLDYGWNQSALAAFVAEVERLDIQEIDVWRQDSAFAHCRAAAFSRHCCLLSLLLPAVCLHSVVCCLLTSLPPLSVYYCMLSVLSSVYVLLLLLLLSPWKSGIV